MSEPKKRGRPPLQAGHRYERINVRLTQPDYDALCRAALRDDATLVEIIRRAIGQFLSPENRQPTRSASH